MNDEMPTDGVSGELMPVSDEEWERMQQDENDLSPAQVERLALLAEEMGEAIQAIGKVLRHGLLNFHPESGVTNRASLEMELGDVLYAMELMESSGDVSTSALATWKEVKRESAAKWLHHQGEAR